MNSRLAVESQVGPRGLPGAPAAPVEPAADVLEEVRAELVRRGGVPAAAAIAAAVRATGRVRGDREVLTLVTALQAELTGAGRLQPLLAEPGVTDVLVNSPTQVWVDRGRGLEPTAVCFPSEQAVRHLAQRLAAQAGRRLDEASPWVDARLPDGSGSDDTPCLRSSHDYYSRRRVLPGFKRPTLNPCQRH